jgi:hypothetical protein
LAKLAALAASMALCTRALMRREDFDAIGTLSQGTVGTHRGPGGKGVSSCRRGLVAAYCSGGE